MTLRREVWNLKPALGLCTAACPCTGASARLWRSVFYQKPLRFDPAPYGLEPEQGFTQCGLAPT